MTCLRGRNPEISPSNSYPAHMIMRYDSKGEERIYSDSVTPTLHSLRPLKVIGSVPSESSADGHRRAFVAIFVNHVASLHPSTSYLPPHRPQNHGFHTRLRL